MKSDLKLIQGTESISMYHSAALDALVYLHSTLQGYAELLAQISV